MPLKFKSVEDLQRQIDDYFKACDNNEKPKPYTITGLALALDTTRETLLDYEKNNPNLSAYSDTIKKAKLRCENYAEEYLFAGKNVVGSIFNLKNNYKWVDKQEIENKTVSETLSPEEREERIRELLSKVNNEDKNQ